jgi:hypothetical protein
MVDLSMSIIGTALREYMSVDWILGVNVVSLGINKSPLQCQKSCVGWDTVRSPMLLSVLSIQFPAEPKISLRIILIK